MFERVTNRIGISITLFLVIAYLAWTNYKSLVFLTNSVQLEELLFCGVGALAFSMVTVMVMRNTRAKIALFTFPLFDVAFVFFGSNIHHAQLLADEPVRFWLSVVVALFTGVTIFSLSMINTKENVIDLKKRVGLLEDELDLKSRELKVCETDVGEIKRECNELQTNNATLKEKEERVAELLNDVESKYKKAESNNDTLKANLKTAISERDKYHSIYLRAEASRIRKKKQKNFTQEDLRILKECEVLTANNN